MMKSVWLALMLALGLSAPLRADPNPNEAPIPNVLIVKVSLPNANSNVQQTVSLIPLNAQLNYDAQGRVSLEQLERLLPSQFQAPAEIPVAIEDQQAALPPEVQALVNADSHDERTLYPRRWHRWSPWGYGGFYGYGYNPYYYNPYYYGSYYPYGYYPYWGYNRWGYNYPYRWGGYGHRRGYGYHYYHR